jgi:hypothetical protein
LSRQGLSLFETIIVSRQGIKRAALYLLAIIIALVLLSPYILGWVMNSSIIKKEISQLIEQKAGLVIDPEKMDFKFLPLPGIQLREIEFSFARSFQLDIKAVNIDLDPLKLLKGKIVVSKIFIETPDIQYTPKENKADSGKGIDIEKKGHFQFKLPKENIQKLFSLLPDTQDKLNFFIKNAKSDYFESLDGSLVVDKLHNSMDLNARILGLQIRNDQFPENPFIKKMDIHSIGSKEITMGLKLKDPGELSGNIKIKAPGILSQKIPDKPLNADLIDLEFKFSKDFLSIQLKPLEISYPKAQVAIDFSDNRKAGQASIKFFGNDIDISQARQVCLKLSGSNQIISQLFDILRGGLANEVTVEFKSNKLATLFDGKNLFLKGSAVNGIVKIPETPLIAENVQGNAIIQKGVIHINAQKGNISSNSIQKGTLDIDLLNHKDIPFSGEFNLHTDISTIPEILISLMPETLLAQELAQVSRISGQADVILKLGMASMQKELDISVQTQNFSAKGFYDRIPLPIIITKGGLGYENNKLTLKDFSGYLKESSFENLSTIVDFSNTPYFDISSAKARLNLNELMPWLLSHEMVMALISPVKPYDGELIVHSTKIQGPVLTPEKWNFDIRGSGENINMGFVPIEPDKSTKPGKSDKPDKVQIKAISGKFEASDQGINVKELKAQIEDLAWLSYAIDPDYLTSIKLPLNVFDSSLENRNDKALLKGKLIFPTGPVLSFDLIGKEIKDLFPKTLILKDKDLSDAMVEFNHDPSQPFLNFEGMLDTQTIEPLLIKDSFLHGLIISSTSGNPVKIYTDANSNLHLALETINLDSFISARDGKEKSPNRPLFDKKNLFFKAKELKYKQKTFTDINTELFFSKEKTDIQIRQGTLCDLSGTGIVELIHEKNQVKTQFNIQALNKEDIADMISCLFKDTTLIDGAYSFTCNFAGQESSDKILNSQNGTLTFHATEGRIYKLTLLSRLLSVLNILDTPDIIQKGFGYRAIEIQADIKDSVIHLKKAIIDADDMALIFSGWIDPLNDKLDLTCLVAPFKTIDNIIKHVPIVNTIFQGRLSLLPAKAMGKISDPVVTPLHPSAVAKGLVNMLENILKAPVRILKGTP